MDLAAGHNIEHSKTLFEHNIPSALKKFVNTRILDRSRLWIKILKFKKSKIHCVTKMCKDYNRFRSLSFHALGVTNTRGFFASMTEVNADCLYLREVNSLSYW